MGVGKGRGEKQTDMAGYGSYSPSLDFVSIPVPHPNFNIPGVDFPVEKLQIQCRFDRNRLCVNY